jgi:uncharacterized protein (TIGR02285 family)
MMQMEQRGRLQALIGYLIEARYLASQQGMAPDQFSFVPIKGVEKYQFNHVGCNANTAGQVAINRINAVLAGLPATTISQFYADWLDPDTRERYLQDAQGGFGDHPAPSQLPATP